VVQSKYTVSWERAAHLLWKSLSGKDKGRVILSETLN